MDVTERFWRFVPEHARRAGPNGDCWEWLGYRTSNDGLPRIQGNGRRDPGKLARRISWEIHRGTIPRNLKVADTCGMKACVNPDHLRLVTQSRLIREAYERRPWEMRGERNGRAKLTDAQVRLVRELRQRGWTYREIAEGVGCAEGSVSALVHGRRRICA